jgi:hypothetical protein
MVRACVHCKGEIPVRRGGAIRGSWDDAEVRVLWERVVAAVEKEEDEEELKEEEEREIER